MASLSPLVSAFLAHPPAHPEDLDPEGQQAWREARLEALRRDDAPLLSALTQRTDEANQADLGHLLADAFQANLPLTPLLTRVAKEAPAADRSEVSLRLLDQPTGETFARLALLWSDRPQRHQETIALALIRAFHRSGSATDLVNQARPYLGLGAGLRTLNQHWPKDSVSKQQAMWPLIQAWLTDPPAQAFVPQSDEVQAILVKALRLATVTDDVALFTFVHQLPGIWDTKAAAFLVDDAIEGIPMPKIMAAFWATEPNDQRKALYAASANQGFDTESVLLRLAGLARLDPHLDTDGLTQVLLEQVVLCGDRKDPEGHLDEMDLDRFIPYVAPAILLEHALPEHGPRQTFAFWARLLCDRLLPAEVLAQQGPRLLGLPGPDLPRTRATLRQATLQDQPASPSSPRRRRS